MRRILECRLVEGRLVERAWWFAGGVWAMSILFALVDLLDGTTHPVMNETGAVGRFGLLAGLMATAATMVALAGVVLRVFRIEHEVTRLLADVIRTEVRSSSAELRMMLTRLDPVQVEDVEGLPVQRAAGDTTRRTRLW